MGAMGLAVGAQWASPLTILSSFWSAYMIQLMVRVFRWFRHTARRPCSRARFKVGMSMAIRTAMMAITTRSSIKVNAPGDPPLAAMRTLSIRPQYVGCFVLARS